jgi:hypothetical protein
MTPGREEEGARESGAARPDVTGWGDVAIFAALTVVVRLLFAFDRGFWQDDANVFALARDARLAHGFLGALAAPMGSPTRLLLGVPSLLADLTPLPVAALHVLHALTWLGIGVAAAALVRTLFPGRPLAAFAAGALTICASSDFLTTSLVAAEYDVAVLGYALFLVGALRFLRGSPWPVLAGACAALLVSVYTIDVAAPALVLAPVLFAIVPAAPRRRLALYAASGLAIAPYALAFARFLKSPGGYASTAMLTLEPGERALRAAILLLNNVLPWQWALDRPTFGVSPPRVIPVALWVLAAGACLTLCARPARRHFARPRAARAGPRTLAALAVLLAMGAASNAAFASVHFSDIFYRTHLLSRVFASVGLGVAVDALVRTRRAWAGWALGATFVAFGALGALERQDYYLSSWRDHRRELSSLVESVPSVAPPASLVLFMPEDPGWHATKADYLARAWVRLLYERAPDLARRTYLWTPGGMSGCRAEGSGLRCFPEAEKSCFEAGTCPGHLLPYEELVVAAFSPLDGRYRLVARGEGATPVAIEAPGYAPERLVGPPGAVPSAMLPRPALARLLPAFKD